MSVWLRDITIVFSMIFQFKIPQTTGGLCPQPPAWQGAVRAGECWGVDTQQLMAQDLVGKWHKARHKEMDLHCCDRCSI